MGERICPERIPWGTSLLPVRQSPVDDGGRHTHISKLMIVVMFVVWTAHICMVNAITPFQMSSFFPCKNICGDSYFSVQRTIIARMIDLITPIQMLSFFPGKNFGWNLHLAKKWATNVTMVDTFAPFQIVFSSLCLIYSHLGEKKCYTYYHHDNCQQFLSFAQSSLLF